MAAKIVSEAIAYEEFEPFCKWNRKEDQDVLEIHLQDFKKEQLKVQISNHGVLKVSGHRPLLDALKHTKFYKEIPVPITIYDTQAIHAKFVNNNLTITLPKLKTFVPEINNKVPSSEPSKIDQTPATESTVGATPAVGGGAKEQMQKPPPIGNALTECQFECRKRTMGSGLTATAAASLATVVVLVAYVMYMYKSTVEIDE